MNRTIISVLVVFAIGVVGLGFYRGWFALSSPSPGMGSNQLNVNLMVDPDKVKDDAGRVKQTATELTGQATEGTR